MTLKEWSKREDLRQQLGASLSSPAGAAALALLRKMALVPTSTGCPQGVDFQQWNSHWGSWREGYAKALRDLESLPHHDTKNLDHDDEPRPWEYAMEDTP
jgi:hypothetical protein